MLQRSLGRARARRSDEGFTLIELVIVIVILGILAAIVVFSVQGITDRGNTAACKANIETINTAVEAYYAKNNSYPTQDSDLTNGFLHAPIPAGYISYGASSAVAPTVKLQTTC